MPVYYDISLPVSAEMPVWPGDPAIRIEKVSSARHNGFNVSRLEMGTHTLTHMDAPRHVKDRGTPVDRLPLDLLIGPAVVVDDKVSANMSSDKVEKVLHDLAQDDLHDLSQK